MGIDGLTMLLLVQQYADASRLLGRVKWQALARTGRPTPVTLEGRSINYGNMAHNRLCCVSCMYRTRFSPIFYLQTAIDYYTVNAI